MYMQDFSGAHEFRFEDCAVLKPGYGEGGQGLLPWLQYIFSLQYRGMSPSHAVMYADDRGLLTPLACLRGATSALDCKLSVGTRVFIPWQNLHPAPQAGTFKVWRVQNG